MKYSTSWASADLKDIQVVKSIVQEMAQDSQNNIRKEQSFLLYDYYHDNQMKYLEDKHSSIFKHTWRDKMRITINLVKKITDAITTTYSSTVKREIVDQPELTETMFMGLNSAMSNLDKIVYTDRSALLGLSWDNENKRPVYRAYPQYLYDMLINDKTRELEMVVVSDWTDSFYMMPTGRVNLRTEEKERRIFVWTKENYWILDGEFKVVAQEGNPKNLNPYKEIPFIHAHMDELFWEDILDPRKALTDSNLMMNIMMSNLMQLSFKQSHAQLWIKMPEDKLNSAGVDDESLKFGSAKEELDFIALGPESALLIGEDAKYLEIKHKSTELINAIVFSLNTIAGSFGLEDATFSVKGDQYSSGIKLTIKKEVLNKMRHERREYFVSVEKRAYNITRNMARTFANVSLPEDSSFVIQFVERPAKIETTEAMSQSVSMLKDAGIYNRVQALTQLHPEKTREEALALCIQMAEEDKKILEALGPVQDVNEQGTMGGLPSDGKASESPEKTRGGPSNSSVTGS